jgi:hypothetical protein
MKKNYGEIFLLISRFVWTVNTFILSTLYCSLSNFTILSKVDFEVLKRQIAGGNEILVKLYFLKKIAAFTFLVRRTAKKAASCN